MKLLTSEDTFEILPLDDGFIFATQQVNHDNKVLVMYKHYSFDNKDISPVTRNVYLLNKFGNNFKLYEEKFKHFLNAKTVQLPHYRTLVAFNSGAAYIYDNKFNLIWSGKVAFNGEGPSDIIMSDKHLWCSFSKSNVIARYGVNTMREELRVGGGGAPAFLEPHGLRAENDFNIFVCNKASNKIREINITNFIVQDYAKFDETVYYYFKIRTFEIVLLKSGIYQL